jgi:hypothetical protein
MKKQGPYRLRILSIIVLSVLSWALIIWAIWMVGGFKFRSEHPPHFVT